MDVSKLVMIIISAVFVNNFILSRFLGLCPFICVSKETKPAFSMGVAVTFVMTSASVITWIVYRYILQPNNITYLRTVSFILVIAVFVQLVEMVVRKTNPALFRALGIYLPLITTNCAVMGVALLNNEMFFEAGHPLAGSFILSLVQGLAAGAGFTLAILLMSGIRERFELMDMPEAMKGLPVTFITASLMSLAFLGFAGFKL